MFVKCSLPFLDWLSALQSRTVKYNTIFVLNRLANLACDDQQEVSQALLHARSVVGPSQKIDLIGTGESQAVLVYTRLTRSRRHRLVLGPSNNSFVDWDFEKYVKNLNEVRDFINYNLNHGNASTIKESLQLIRPKQITDAISQNLELSHDDILDAISCLDSQDSQRFANLLKILNCTFERKADPASEQARVGRMIARRDRLRLLRGTATDGEAATAPQTQAQAMEKRS